LWDDEKGESIQEGIAVFSVAPYLVFTQQGWDLRFGLGNSLQIRTGIALGLKNLKTPFV
jgi:hypothetical protein